MLTTMIERRDWMGDVAMGVPGLPGLMYFTGPDGDRRYFNTRVATVDLVARYVDSLVSEADAGQDFDGAPIGGDELAQVRANATQWLGLLSEILRRHPDVDSNEKFVPLYEQLLADLGGTK